MAAQEDGRTDSGPDTRPSGRTALLPLFALKADPIVPARVVTDAEVALAVSEVQEAGLLRPLLVRPGSGVDTYYVFSGGLMLQALRSINLEAVTVEIFDDLTPEQALWLASSEQHVRTEWSPIRQARVVHQLTTQSDGNIDETAVDRCRVLFASGRKERLTRRWIRAQRQVAEVFSAVEAERRNIPSAELERVSGRELIRLTQQSDPWHALLRTLEGQGGDERSVDGRQQVRVRRRKDGGRSISLPGHPPEEWDSRSVQRFLDEVGPIYSRLAGAHPQTPVAEAAAKPVGGDAPQDHELVRERNALLRRVAYLATELATARGIIAALHGTRAVQERRRSDAMKAVGSAESRSPRWLSRLWPLARKRVSAAHETRFRKAER